MKKLLFLVAFLALGFSLGAQAPSNLTITNNGDRLSLSWDGPDNAINYQLYWQKHPELQFYYYPYAETTETYIDTLPFIAGYTNGYYLVSQCEDGSEYISDTVYAPGKIALDYTLVDCHGNEHRVYDILDRGQYIFITCFEYYYDGSREIMPYIEEAYRYYGCNMGDVFFMEIAPGNQDDLCLQWEEEFGVEYPTIGKEGGSLDFARLYGIINQPHYAIIAPNHTIAYTTGLNHFYIDSFQSIKDAFDLFGIEEHQCDNNGSDCEAPSNLTITNNGNRLSLSWDGSDNAVNYQLYWQKAPGIPAYYYSETIETFIDSLPFRGLLDDGYYVVAQCGDGTESVSDTVYASGNIALDFPLVDCHGNEFNLYDILDRGQYVFIDAFFWHCDGCRVIMPYIEEAYRYYGCNNGDVFFMEVTPEDHDNVCLMWEEEFGVEYPTIGKDGGSQRFMWMYGINSYPNFLIIAPDHTIAYSWLLDHFVVDSFQSIKDAFDLFGIEEHQCDHGVMEGTMKDLIVSPNPADDYVSLSVEHLDEVRVYNVLGQLMDSYLAESESIRLATDSYPNGLYVVQIKGKGSARFVVRH